MWEPMDTAIRVMLFAPSLGYTGAITQEHTVTLYVYDTILDSMDFMLRFIDLVLYLKAFERLG